MKLQPLFVCHVQDWERCERGIGGSLEKLRAFKRQLSQPLPDHHEDLQAEQMRCKVTASRHLSSSGNFTHRKLYISITQDENTSVESVELPSYLICLGDFQKCTDIVVQDEVLVKVLSARFTNECFNFFKLLLFQDLENTFDGWTGDLAHLTVLRESLSCYISAEDLSVLQERIELLHRQWDEICHQVHPSALLQTCALLIL